MVRGSFGSGIDALLSTDLEGLQALDEYCVASLRDTQPRKRGELTRATTRYTGHGVEHGAVATAAQGITEMRHDASVVGAGGIQRRKRRSAPHDEDVSREATAVNYRP